MIKILRSAGWLTASLAPIFGFSLAAIADDSATLSLGNCELRLQAENIVIALEGGRVTYNLMTVGSRSILSSRQFSPEYIESPRVHVLAQRQIAGLSLYRLKLGDQLEEGFVYDTPLTYLHDGVDEITVIGAIEDLIWIDSGESNANPLDCDASEEASAVE